MGKVSNRHRFLVLRRDGFRCVYCGRSAGEAELHIDHVEAAALGGPDEIANYVTACINCNYGKGTLSIMAKQDLPARVEVASTPSLAGKCFVKLDDGGKAAMQGVVRAKVSDDVYLVQYFDWLLGEPNTMELVLLHTMVDPGWVFFEDDAHLRSWKEGAGKARFT